jgi:hypothetical protein
MLTTVEKSELKPVAAYINGLPPIEEWVNTRLQLSPGIALEIETFWKWLGLSLNAYFSDASNPLPHAGLNEIMEREVQKATSKYLSLSILIFQAEHFIRQEARAQEIVWMDSLSRSDILKAWAWEQCHFDIWIALQTHWESHCQAQQSERFRKTQQWARGEISDAELEALKDKWSKEDTKLVQPNPPDDLLHLTTLLLKTFKKYRDQLPEFSHFIELWQQNEAIKKFMVVNGEFEHPPVRGKGKKRGSKKEPLRSLLSKRHTSQPS